MGERALAIRGKRIVVTRAGTQGAELVCQLEALGATVVHCPSVQIVPLEDNSQLQHAVQTLDDYNWMLFTSTNAVQAVALQLERERVRYTRFPSIAAVGSATAKAIREQGWSLDFVPAGSSGRALATSLPVLGAERILLPRADIASADVPNILRDRGCVVDEIVAYTTIAGADVETVRSLMSGRCDALTFTSPSTVNGFVTSANAVGWNLCIAQRTGQLSMVCIGETTASALQQRDLHADAVASDQSMNGLIDALLDVFSQQGASTHASNKSSGRV